MRFLGFLLLLAVVLGFTLTCYESSFHDKQDLGNPLIYNRVWESHSATSDQDIVTSLILAEGKSGIGILIKGSEYREEHDLLIHSRKTDTDSYLTMNLLQTNSKQNVSLRAYNCDVGLYEYCLEVKILPKPYNNTVMFYSADGMEVDASVLNTNLLKNNLSFWISALDN